MTDCQVVFSHCEGTLLSGLSFFFPLLLLFFSLRCFFFFERYVGRIEMILPDLLQLFRVFLLPNNASAVNPFSLRAILREPLILRL